MKITHTPGPWGIMNDGLGDGKPWTAYGEAAAGLTLASPHNTEPICRVSGYCQPVEANARLIATAPELLEALKAIINHEPVLNVLAPRESLGSLLAQAEAAIKKAEGAK